MNSCYYTVKFSDMLFCVKAYLFMGFEKTEFFLSIIISFLKIKNTLN